MCKRKSSETTLHEQCTPKRPRWLRLSFSKSASSCSPFLQSSLSTRLAKPEPTLVDHETTPTTHINNNSCIGGGSSTSTSTCTIIATNHDLVPTQQDHQFILNQPEPASPDSRCSSIDDDELPDPPMDLGLLPTLVYRPSSKVVFKTSPPFLADQQAFGGNFHHNHNHLSLQQQSKHQHHQIRKQKAKQRHILAGHSNNGWKLKSSDNDVNKDGASVGAVAAATAVSLNHLPHAGCVQMWVCCACETDNGGDVVWCTNKSCNHYTVNCLDCFSY